jgi:hypothetical protein
MTHTRKSSYADKLWTEPSSGSRSQPTGRVGPAVVGPKAPTHPASVGLHVSIKDTKDEP